MNASHTYEALSIVFELKTHAFVKASRVDFTIAVA